MIRWRRSTNLLIRSPIDRRDGVQGHVVRWDACLEATNRAVLANDIGFIIDSSFEFGETVAEFRFAVLRRFRFRWEHSYARIARRAIL